GRPVVPDLAIPGDQPRRVLQGAGAARPARLLRRPGADRAAAHPAQRQPAAQTGGVMERLANIFHLGIKELRSLQHDLALVLLILWAFSLGVYSSATSMPESLHNAAIAVVDEDQSQLSERLVQAFQAPYFRTPERIDLGQMDQGMDSGRYTFTLNIPPDFQRDVLAGR